MPNTPILIFMAGIFRGALLAFIEQNRSKMMRV